MGRAMLGAIFGLILTGFPQAAGAGALDEVNIALDQPIKPRSNGSCPTPEQFSVTRPDPPGAPTVVGLAAVFEDVFALSDVDPTITADVTLLARWRDPRLADSNRGDGSGDCTASVKPFWLPAQQPENLRARERFYDGRILINAQGIVTMVRRVIVQVAQPMDFRDFPLDHHTWRFAVLPVDSNSSEMLFHTLPWTSGPARPTLQGWRLGSPKPLATVTQLVNRLGAFARFEVALEVRRMPQYYGWKLGLPLLLIAMMAYLAFFIPRSMVPQQISLGMTAILTAVAYMFALNTSLPKIGYATRADSLFITVIALAFFSLFQGVLTAALQSGNRGDIITRFERIGRYLYPAVMVTAFVLVLVI